MSPPTSKSELHHEKALPFRRKEALLHFKKDLLVVNFRHVLNEHQKLIGIAPFVLSQICSNI